MSFWFVLDLTRANYEGDVKAWNICLANACTQLRKWSVQITVSLSTLGLFPDFAPYWAKIWSRGATLLEWVIKSSLRPFSRWGILKMTDISYREWAYVLKAFTAAFTNKKSTNSIVHYRHSRCLLFAHGCSWAATVSHHSHRFVMVHGSYTCNMHGMSDWHQPPLVTRKALEMPKERTKRTHET